jgi:hypothetical protein
MWRERFGKTAKDTLDNIYAHIAWRYPVWGKTCRFRP